jgi:hypothetical protein
VKTDVPYRLQLSDVLSWWSTAASCLRSATDTSLFLHTARSRRFAVTEFATIQWQLHNSPLPELSTYAKPTPQLKERVGHALARLAKLSKGSLRKNNIPVGGTMDRGHGRASGSASTGNMLSSQSQDSNSRRKDQQCGDSITAVPSALDMDVSNDTVARTSPVSIPIPHNQEAQARSFSAYTRASSTAQDAPIIPLNSTSAREIPLHNPADPSIGRPKKRRSAKGRTKSETKLPMELNQSGEELRRSAQNNGAEPIIKGGAESEREIAYPAVPTTISTKKRKRKALVTFHSDDATSEKSDALPEMAAANPLPPGPSNAIPNAPPTVRTKRSRPKKTPKLDSIVSSPESNRIQESSRCVLSCLAPSTLR